MSETITLSDSLPWAKRDRSCIQCGSTYRSREPKQVFCSRECRSQSRRPTEYRPCEQCGEPILQDHRRLRFCNRDCVLAHRRRTQAQSTCDHCGIVFSHNPRRPRRYCSPDCQKAVRRANRRPDRACEHCGKMFRPTKDRNRYCSRSCGNMGTRGGLLPDEEDLLVQMVAEYPLSAIAQAIEKRHGNRYTPVSLRERAYRMGLHTRVEPGKYFTTFQLAEILKISPECFRRWMADHQFPAKFYPGEASRRISRANLMRWAKGAGFQTLVKSKVDLQALGELVGTDLIEQIQAARQRPVYASDGRRWDNLEEAAAAFRILPSSLRTAIREGKAVRRQVYCSWVPFGAPLVPIHSMAKTVYSSDGRSWPSCRAAAEELFMTVDAVRRACSLKRPTQLGIALSYEEEPTYDPYQQPARRVYACDGRSWPTARMAAQELGVAVGTVRRAAKLQLQLMRVPVTLSYSPDPKPAPANGNATKTVYSSDGRSWPSAMAASQELGIPLATVRSAARETSLTRLGIVLSHSPDPVYQRKPRATKVVYASDGRSWPSPEAAARDLGIKQATVWRRIAAGRIDRNGITLSYEPLGHETERPNLRVLVKRAGPPEALATGKPGPGERIPA